MYDPSSGNLVDSVSEETKQEEEQLQIKKRILITNLNMKKSIRKTTSTRKEEEQNDEHQGFNSNWGSTGS
jgi:hypothetical protein